MQFCSFAVVGLAGVDSGAGDPFATLLGVTAGQEFNAFERDATDAARSVPVDNLGC